LKLHTDTSPALNTVTAYGDGYIEINRVRFAHAVAFGANGEISAWPVADAAAISTALLRQAARLPETTADPMAWFDEPDAQAGAPAPLPSDAPEVLLVGTGARQQFLPAATLAPLLRMGIGVEIMDTQAAARTYNILMAEGRNVVAALIPAGVIPL